MIRWMLCQIEKVPTAVFYQKDLVKRFPSYFEQAKKDRLICQLPHPLSTRNPFTIHSLNSTYLVVPNDDGVLEAFDTNDTEAEAIELLPGDIIQWTLNLDEVAKIFLQLNGLGGHSQALDDRLHFIGSRLVEGSRAAFILSLFNNEVTALKCMRMLSNILVNPYDRYIVVCPSFTPTPTLVREINSLRMIVVTLREDNPWVIDLPAQLRPYASKGRKVILTETQEDEFKNYGFRVRLPIHITALSAGRNATIVLLDGNQVSIPLADFRLFIFLIIALFLHEDGFLSWNDIKYSVEDVGENLIAPEGLEQAVSRLRSRFKSPLGGLKGNEFIERKSWRVRISTHRKFITYDRNGLLNHFDPLVRQLVQRLPDDPQYNRNV